MRRVSYILLALFGFVACEQEEVHSYLGEDCVQFTGEKEIEEYTFAYVPDDVNRDTVWIDAHISGDIFMEKRYYKLKQAVHYSYERIYDADGSLLNEYLVETANQAIAGIHYVPFDDPGYQQLCYVDSNKVDFKVPVIVLRDISLDDNDKLLNIEFVESDDFKVGDYNTKQQVLMISDDVTYPEWWPTNGPGPNSKYKDPVLGAYGPVKHRLMIQVTGKKWDDEFLQNLTYEERVSYKNICSKALYDLNLERAANGLGPLMEDPAFVNGPVTFI